jgi:predicted dehydrogenase
MLSRPRNILIVGAGVMGQVYARAIATTDLRFRARVSGVCDVDEAAATALAAEVDATPYRDLEAAVAGADADLAYVAVPDHLHRDPFIACVTAGMACLVEKPLATTVEDALAMRAAARAAGALAEVNFSNRCNPAFQRVAEAIADGALGELIGANARLSNVIDYPLKHLSWASRTTSGWFLLSHVFDVVHWLTGAQAVEVTATGHAGRLAATGIAAPDLIHSLVRYDTALSGIYESAWVLPRSLPSPVDFKLELIGTDGAAYVDMQDQMVRIAGAETFTYPGTVDWTQSRLSAFLDRLDDGAAANPTEQLDDGIENVRMLVALHDALDRRAPVAVARSTEGEDA